MLVLLGVHGVFHSGQESIALVTLPIEGEGWGEGLLRVLFGALATFVCS